MARAEAPMRLSGVVTDTTSSVSPSDAARVEQAATQLRQETGAGLYLVVVQGFSNPSDGNEWAGQVAERSNLGDSDVILFIGLSERKFGLNATQELGLSFSQLKSIENSEVKRRINNGDIAGAGVAAASGLREALTGQGTGSAGSDSNSGSSTSRMDSFFASTQLLFLLVIVLFVSVLATIWISFARRNRRAKLARETEQKRLEEFNAQAAQQLVRMDDQLAAAEQEAGFAEAQFGQKPVTPFRAAIDEARVKTQQAFALQNQILDHIPEPNALRIEWAQQILQLTHEASSRLAAEYEHFKQLRDMERNAPELLRQIAARTEQLSDEVAKARRSLEELRGRYEASALRPIDDAAEQADRLLQLAIAEASSASEHLKHGRGGEAVVDIGDGQQAIANTETALESITHMRSQLEHAEQMIAAEIADMTPDVERMRDGGGVPGMSLELVERARQAAMGAKQAILAAQAPGASSRDPLTVLERLRAANRELDEAVRVKQETQHRLEMLRRRFERTVDSARAKIRQCGDYIATHRGVTGEGPRARLRQAEDMLEQAEQRAVEDIEWAAQTAQAAEQAASGALTQAMEEASRHDPSRGYGYASRGSATTEAIIGGIIGGILSSAGNSHRRGGFRSRSGFRSGGGFSLGGGFRSGGGFSSGGGFR